MSKVISIINLKGGVGKTTITVGLAEFLVLVKQYKVLVIDLDPQTNSTVSLIGEDEWASRNRSNRTLYHLFKDQFLREALMFFVIDASTPRYDIPDIEGFIKERFNQAIEGNDGGDRNGTSLTKNLATIVGDQFFH